LRWRVKGEWKKGAENQFEEPCRGRGGKEKEPDSEMYGY
jgi:hypothetical protein